MQVLKLPSTPPDQKGRDGNNHKAIGIRTAAIPEADYGTGGRSEQKDGDEPCQCEPNQRLDPQARSLIPFPETGFSGANGRGGSGNRQLRSLKAAKATSGH